MKISKVSFVIAILGIGAWLDCARAQDNPAQAAARAALEQKFQETTPPRATTVPGQPPVLTDMQAAATVQGPAGSAASEAAAQAAIKAKIAAQAAADAQTLAGV